MQTVAYKSKQQIGSHLSSLLTFAHSPVFYGIYKLYIVFTDFTCNNNNNNNNNKKVLIAHV